MISAAECRQHIEPHLETQTICYHRLHCPPCPPMAFWNRAGVGCFWLTYDPQKQFPSLEVRLTMSCSALWAVDLGWSNQDTFQAGTFGGFPTSCFAPPVLTTNWILIRSQLSQLKDSQNVVGFPNWHVSGCQQRIVKMSLIHFQEQVGWGTWLTKCDTQTNRHISKVAHFFLLTWGPN